MTVSSSSGRKASQEVEIDHLLAEEFECDPGFAERFVRACGLRFATLKVKRVLPEPQFGSEGYGALLVEADMDGRRIALLIEDKINASPATRQTERYSTHAERLKRQGVECLSVAL